MERGPLALFGAIVAVGVGPALWMGVQLGAMSNEDSPARPPVVNQQRADKTGQELLGGTGAGEQTNDSPATEPRGHVVPLTTSPSAEPSSSASREPSPSATSPSAEPSPTSDSPSTPPTESTTQPAGDPTDTTEPPVEVTDDPTVPPSPPVGNDDENDDEGGSYGGYVEAEDSGR
ncbi:hypothetical protein JIG36_24525 [Actinoplanes sp. LDG1-06]|uniref:Uncharacterized protein n=1 Tax=Paractinoplanes ovalisporus TaxID=2810368 RepID=A0ABS2AH95_9ACTN|nr:hypothetical protein [Actinoplanes ovalisporus]MBM2618728.1 hypothetical protein [Actinoplanes ovalisporus]